MRRREFLKAAGAAGAAAALPASAEAQGVADFPSKPITLIMSWPAGTGIDMWHRAMADADHATRYMDSDDYARFVRQQVDEQKDVIEKLGLARKS